jgi:hypothetical protein
MHALLDEPKTRSNAYFELRRMDSTMRNAMKKSRHKITDLVVNDQVFNENEDNYILITTSGCEGEYRDRVVKIYKYLGILKLETQEGGREPLGNVSPEEMYEICSALHSKC